MSAQIIAMDHPALADPETAPVVRPLCANFSSGPCPKRPGWSFDQLGDAWLGRSHRAAGGKAKLKAVIDQSAELLGLPEDWVLAIVPASDTGAVEMALWSMLGQRPVDMLVWESFGNDWAKDVAGQLKIDHRILKADYGQLPDLASVNMDHDVVFTFNGTTSGVRVANCDWISDKREGLVFCDATSAAFAMEMPFEKLDVVTWSWQKCLGGEAAHGMLALSPRAVERLETYDPGRPLPKLFRMTKNGKLNASLFQGATLNTPSMLAVEDALDGLKWAKEIGGVVTLVERTTRNLAAVAAWVEETPWIEFLAQDEAARSSTSICLALTEPTDPEAQTNRVKAMVKWLEAEGIAFDINGYRDAPTGLRIWGGPTVEVSDMEALLPWITAAYTVTGDAS